MAGVQQQVHQHLLQLDALAGHVMAVAGPLQLGGPWPVLPLRVDGGSVLAMVLAAVDVLQPADKAGSSQQPLAAGVAAAVLDAGMDTVALAVGQGVGGGDVEGVAPVAPGIAVFITTEPAQMPLGAAVLPAQHQAGVVVILQPEVVAGTEPETVRGGGQQAKGYLLDAGFQGRVRSELPAQPCVVDGIEAVVPAVLGRKGQRAGAGFQVGAQKFQVDAVGGAVIQPAVVETDGAADVQIGVFFCAVFGHCVSGETSGKGGRDDQGESPHEQLLCLHLHC